MYKNNLVFLRWIQTSKVFANELVIRNIIGHKINIENNILINNHLFINKLFKFR